jgi:hypothetical protein
MCTEGYSVSKDRITLDHKAAQARERRAREAKRRQALNVLDEMKVLKVQKAIGRARRKT